MAIATSDLENSHDPQVHPQPRHRCACRGVARLRCQCHGAQPRRPPEWSPKRPSEWSPAFPPPGLLEALPRARLCAAGWLRRARDRARPVHLPDRQLHAGGHRRVPGSVHQGNGKRAGRRQRSGASRAGSRELRRPDLSGLPEGKPAGRAGRDEEELIRPSAKGPVVSSIGHFLGFQLHHVPWEGFRFYDLIFPLFIFVTGVSIVLSLPRLVEREGTWRAHARVLRRALLLYGLGLIYYGGISQHWADIRYLGVLQRIALCYLFASLLFLNLNLRGMMVAFVSLLARRALSAGAIVGQDARSGGDAQHPAGDRQLSAGCVRRLAAEGRAADGAIQIVVADRRRDRAGCRRP